MAALVVGLVTASSAAWALGKNEILQLQAAGLAPEMMVQVIRASTEPVTITPAEVEELRANGVPQPVLDEICLRIGGCMMAAPGATPGFAPGVGPNLDAEMQRQRELEEAQRQAEMQRLAAEQEALRQQMAENAARNRQAETTIAGQVEANRAYQAGRYAEAAAAFENFMTSVQPDPNTLEHYEALCGFVRSMHARGYRHIIRTRALQAVSYGPLSTNFVEMFNILVDVTNDAQFLDPQFESMADYTIGEFAPEFQDTFNFFMGRFFWAYNDINRALGFFTRMSDVSPDRAKAHYLAGALLLTEQRNREAYGQFEAAIEVADATGNTDVYELAFLALARLSYELGLYDAALYYYQKVEAGSHRHPRTIFETMWTFYMKRDWNRAIGRVHALHSPYYDNWFWPDLYVIEAASYLQTCNLDEAERAVMEFDAVIDPIQSATQEFIVSITTPQEAWFAVNSYYDDIRSSAGSELPLAAVRHIMAQAEFLDKARLLGQLQMERDLLGRDGATLGNWGSTASTLLESDYMTKEIEAGLSITAMLREFSNELTDWDVKAQEIGFEVTTERLGIIDATLEGAAGGEGASAVFVLAADWQSWPFEGEYWLDEVDNYRGDLVNYRDPRTNQCTSPVTTTTPTL